MRVKGRASLDRVSDAGGAFDACGVGPQPLIAVGSRAVTKSARVGRAQSPLAPGRFRAWRCRITSSAEEKEAAQEAARNAMTKSQQQAVAKAESYLEFQGFTRTGLIRQLTSQFEGYSKSDATFAVDFLDVNWNLQAAKKAESYLESQPFSRAALIRQLTSQFEGFTRAQALYGVKSVGLRLTPPASLSDSRGRGDAETVDLRPFH